MDGYKVRHGLSLDARLAVVARRAGLKRGEALALWIAVLDHASRNAPRGSIEGLDAEEIAAALDFETAAAEAALAAFRDKKMIGAGNAIAGWGKMQTGASTLRSRACRARKQHSREKPAVKNLLPEEEETARRRERLGAEMLARHGRRGRAIAKTRPLPKQL